MHLIPVLSRQLFGRLFDVCADAIDEDIEPTKLLDGLFDQAAYLIRLLDIETQAQRREAP